MAEYTCHNCVYAVCDPCRWLRLVWAGESIWPQCGNHPQWPGRMHDVPGVPCRNYRPRPEPPEGENVRCIPLDDGGYVYVDAADYDWLSQWHWHLYNGYAGRSEKGMLVLMHREIMNPPRGTIVDHKDGSKANNCRFNLRVCTREQNMHNKRKQTRSVSKYKGSISTGERARGALTAGTRAGTTAWAVSATTKSPPPAPTTAGRSNGSASSPA